MATTTGITCPCCGETIRVELSVAGQRRAAEGNVTFIIHADLEHIESHRP